MARSKQSGSQNFDGGVSLGGDATLHAASGFIKLKWNCGRDLRPHYWKQHASCTYRQSDYYK